MKTLRDVSVICIMGVLCIRGEKQCSNHVCFNWRVTYNNLTLTCKIENLCFQVFIFNQFNQEQAHCYPHSRGIILCYSNVKNITVSPIKKINGNYSEVILTVKGKIDYHVNGNWTCRHGHRNDVAKVEVTVLRIKERMEVTDCCQQINITDDKTGWTDMLCVVTPLGCTLTAYVICLVILSLVFTSTFDVIVKKICKCQRFLEWQKSVAVYKKAILCFVTVILIIPSIIVGITECPLKSSTFVALIGGGSLIGTLSSVLIIDKEFSDVHVDVDNRIHQSDTLIPEQDEHQV